MMKRALGILEPAGIFAEQRDQRLLKVASGVGDLCRRRRYSALIPAARITFAHFSV